MECKLSGAAGNAGRQLRMIRFIGQPAFVAACSNLLWIVVLHLWQRGLALFMRLY